MIAPPMVDSVTGFGSADTRRSDPETSHEARDSSNAAASLGAVLATLRTEGAMTDEQLVLAMEVAHEWDRVPLFTEQRIRTARAALVKFGLVADAGYHRINSRGRRMRVWQVTR